MIGAIYFEMYRNESPATLKQLLRSTDQSIRALAVLAIAHQRGAYTARKWCNQHGRCARNALQYARFLLSSPVY